MCLKQELVDISSLKLSYIPDELKELKPFYVNELKYLILMSWIQSLSLTSSAVSLDSYQSIITDVLSKYLSLGVELFAVEIFAEKEYQLIQ